MKHLLRNGRKVSTVGLGEAFPLKYSDSVSAIWLKEKVKRAPDCIAYGGEKN